MNILFIDWPCFGHDDVLDFFSEKNYHVVSFSHADYDLRKSSPFINSITPLFEKNNFDFCFSYNYFPLVAKVCKQYHTPYISFVYDNPQVKLYSYTVIYPTNYIFVFDSSIVEQFQKSGISTIHYMPLPVNAGKIDTLLKKTYDKERLQAEISFVGSLYNEEHNLYDSLTELSPYTKGFLEGLLKAQSKVYGYNFIEECLTPSIIEDMQNNAHYKKNIDGVEPLSYIFSDYFLCRKLTSIERIHFLTKISEQFPLRVFTQNATVPLGNSQNMGLADYNSEMPYIFHNSKINLNFTLRSIKNGIPLRCMDIMASGGFLLTNFQSDFLKHFVPDEDFVYFENEYDLLKKIDYYLTHDSERLSIAHSGYEKVKNHHNYSTIFNQIFHIVFSQPF